VRLNYARAFAAAPMVRERLTRTCPQMPMANAGTAIQPGAGAPTAQPLPQVGIIQSINCPVRGAVTADTITNSISITDIPTALTDLERYARRLDLRQPQVNIKAKIILVDRTSLEGLGLRYDLGSRQQFFNDIVPRLDSAGKPRIDPGQILLGGNTVSAIANATQRIPAAALQLVYSTAMGNFDFTTFLEALQQTTLLDVQAEPSASVLNNRTANLTAGTQVPIRVIDAGAGGNQTSSFPRAAVSFQQTGVILTVTPQITANRQIQMKVHVENSDVQFQANDVGAVFPTQKVDNEVLVADGETAVMGGLTQTTLSVTKSGLPILVDLPIIGRLFGVTTRQEVKRDLLILITPHIIDDGQQAPPNPPETGRP
jgi:type IV pilus assembly protein PilQ